MEQLIIPKQFTTSEGVPFYVNTLSNIMARCLGNRHIAESLVRYPVMANTFKYVTKQT